MNSNPKRTEPLPLPEGFNEETFLIAQTTEYGTFHESRKGARLARDLVANGTPQDLALAQQVLAAVLGCQEKRPEDPNYGNFMWMVEDDVVFDLNAVEFNLEQFIPMMIQHSDRLPATLQSQILEAIRLGLEAIRRLDVLVAYTNITVLDILNSSLGGELLNDKAIAQRGYQKLIDWMALTDQYGHPFEYNSPTYTAVTIRALKQLVDLVQDEATKIRAKTVMARLGVSVALHIHPKTGRWAGPHSRAYHPSVVGERPPESEMVRAWVGDGTLPSWTLDLMASHSDQLTVSETANVERNLGLTTYHSQSFALGVAASGSGGQANVFLAQYDLTNTNSSKPNDSGSGGSTSDSAELSKPEENRPGVLYSRYLLNDKWLGDSYHATDRSMSRNLLDEGNFFGVQNGSRAIGLYTPQGNLGLCSSAKACLIWTQRDKIDEIWVGQQRVEQLPTTVLPEQIVVIGSGDTLVAIRPLTLTKLGRSTPIRLVERDGNLVLELVNYEGSAKHFWEARWPGAFYRGKTQCGYYAELAERSDYSDGLAFSQEVASGQWVDETAAPFTYAGEGERNWTVSYTRNEQTVGIEVDLMAWRLGRRWTQDGELGWPMLESPLARQNRTGRIEVGEAILECGREAAWLAELPNGQGWVAGYHGPTPAPFKLITPEGEVSLASITTGTVVWKGGHVTVDALGVEAPPEIKRID